MALYSTIKNLSAVFCRKFFNIEKNVTKHILVLKNQSVSLCSFLFSKSVGVANNLDHRPMYIDCTVTFAPRSFSKDEIGLDNSNEVNPIVQEHP